MPPKLIHIALEHKGEKTHEYVIEKESFDPKTGEIVKQEMKVDPAVLAERKVRLAEEIVQIETLVARIDNNEFDEVRSKPDGKAQ